MERRRWSAKTQTPTLMVAGAHDKQVPPDRVRELYDDLGAPQKVFVDLGVLVAQRDVGEEPPAAVPARRSSCLTDGTVNGAKQGWSARIQ